MSDFSQHPVLLAWVYSLGWTLLHMLWQGALVGAAYGLARWLIGPSHAHWRYVAGLVAMGVMAVLPVVTLVSLMSAPVLAPAGTAAAALGATVAVNAAEAGGGFSLEPWLPWIVAAWSLGVAAYSGRATYHYWQLRRLCRLEAQPLPEWESRLRELAQRFGVTRPVRLVRSAIVQTPSLIGWIAPVIMLPASVLVGLTPKQIELVIAHELGHIRRWDYAVNLLQIALETVLFYHPVVHWISREVRHDREACCDDLVLRLGADPMDYATTLATLEDLRGVTHVPAIPATGGFLLGRIRRIVGADPNFAQPISGGQSLMVLAIAGAVLMAAQPLTRNVIGGLIDSEPVRAERVDSATVSLARAAAVSFEQVLQTARRETPALAPVVTDIAPDTLAVATPVATAPTEVAPTLPTPRIAFAVERASAPALAVDTAAPDLRADLAVATLPAAVEAPLAALRAIRTAAPVYPRQAAIDGTEGQVTLSFYVDWSGRATQIAVVGATEPGTFDSAAIAALRDWRFATDGDSQRRRYTQTFDFTLDGKSAPASTTDECLTPLGTRICRRSLNEIGTARTEVIEGPEAASRSEWLRVSADSRGG